ncbi:MAG TPA: DUF6516 family protein [Candidatus Saccharimonadales bacterium]|nr:DUF6516 family protein [Candidatus Saccharimonadales bacterium]
MSAPLDDIASYSALVYALTERHSFVTSSTLALVPIGATLAQLEGCIECRGGIQYDSWEHPEIPALATTFPHHKHIQPSLRDNRVPAPGISFESPNLDVVLEDIRRDWLH